MSPKFVLLVLLIHIASANESLQECSSSNTDGSNECDAHAIESPRDLISATAELRHLVEAAETADAALRDAISRAKQVLEAGASSAEAPGTIALLQHSTAAVRGHSFGNVLRGCH